MNDKQSGLAPSPTIKLGSLFRRHGLLTSLVKREISARYRASTLGLLWILINPLLMLGVYTFVFSIVFKSRWPGGSGSTAEYALAIFAGLSVFNLFSEVFVRSPGSILGNINFVKKIVFPLELLPLVTLGVACFQFLLNMIVWALFHLLLIGLPPKSALLLPIIVFPLCLFSAGIGWFLSALGVYVRDIAHLVGNVVTVLLFLSPIFYSTQQVPDKLQQLLMLNPLSHYIEQSRNALLWSGSIDWTSHLTHTVLAIAIFVAGHKWFRFARKGFADVL